MSSRTIIWLVALLGAALVLILLWSDAERAPIRPSAAPPVPEEAPEPAPRLEGAAPMTPDPGEPEPAPSPAPPAAEPVARRTDFRVVDAEDGAALPEAEVQLSSTSFRLEVLGEGRFALVGHDFPEGYSMQVLVRAAGHMPWEFDLAPGADMPACVRLERAGSIHGVVRLESGAPVSGATVRAGSATAESDAEGAYRLEPVPLRERIFVGARSALGLAKPADAVTLQLWRREVQVDLVVVLGLEHRVEVRTTEGRPIAGANIQLEWSDRRFPPVQRRAETSADGTAVLTGLRSSTYLLVVAADGYEPHWLEDLRLPAETTVVVLPDAANHWVEGSVVDPRGAPIRGVTVDIRGDRFDPVHSVRTNRRGCFRIEGLQRRPRFTNFGGIGTPLVRIYLHKKGYADISYLAPFDLAEAYVMEQPATLRGRVLFPDGRPVPKPYLSIAYIDVGPAYAYTEANTWPPGRTSDMHETHADGTFEMTGLMGVPAWLGAGDGTGVLLGVRVAVNLQPGGEVDVGDLVLVEPASIEGRLVGTAFPVENSDLRHWLVLHDRTEPWVGFGRVHDGSYAQSGLRARTYEVSFVRDGWVSGSVTVSVEEGATARADLPVWRAGSITAAFDDAPRGGLTGRIRCEGPHEEAFARRNWRVVEVGRQRKLEEVAAPDRLPFEADGSVTFERLPPGRYVVEACDGKRVIVTKRVELAEAEAAYLTFE